MQTFKASQLLNFFPRKWVGCCSVRPRFSKKSFPPPLGGGGSMEKKPEVYKSAGSPGDEARVVDFYKENGNV